jgi:hypothetical protein
MIEFIIGGSIAALVLGFIVSRSLEIHARKGLPDVCVSNKSIATYYPGKEKNGNITPALALKIYKRDHWRCQYPGCGILVTNGIANTFWEHIQGMAGAEPGNINHKHIPDFYGGPAIPENLEVMCQHHNIRLGKKIRREAFKWLAERGETIYLKTKDLLR